LLAVLAGAVGALEGEAFCELFLNTSFSSGSELMLAVLIPRKRGPFLVLPVLAVLAGCLPPVGAALLSVLILLVSYKKGTV